MASSWRLEDFRGDWNEAAFVERLGECVGGGAGWANSGAVEAALAGAITRLRALGRQASDGAASAAVALSEAQQRHQRRLSALHTQLDAVMGRFEAVDARIASVAHTAVRIGDRLEGVHEAKRRTQRGQAVIAAFLALNRQPGVYPPLFKASKARHLRDAARMVQALQRVAADVHIPNTRVAADNISGAAADIEKQLLEEFDEAYAAMHVDGMRAAAAPLLNFDGGHLTSRFVAEATAPLAVYTPGTGTGDEAGAGAGAASVEQYQHRLAKLYASIVTLCSKNCPLIAAVFPAPARIVRLFLERIFEDNVSSFLELGLSHNTSNTDYLAVLEITFDQTSELVRDIGDIEMSLSPEAVASIKQTLQEQTDSIFCRYRDQTASRLLDDLAQQSRQATQDALSIPVGAVPEKAADGDFFSRFVKSKPADDDVKTWLRAVFDSNVIAKLLASCTTALTRCDKLADPEQAPALVHQLFKALLDPLGRPFLYRLIDTAVRLLPDDDAKVDLDPFLLEFVAVVDRNVHRIDAHFAGEVLPRMQTALNTQTICAREKQELLSGLEYKLVRALGHLLDHVLQQCGRILARDQRKSDYRPRDDSNVLPDGSGCSKAAAAVVDVVRTHAKHVMTHLNGLNLDNYLSVFGLRLRHLLMTHLRKFTVSNAGALLLMRDVREYHDCAGEFHVSAVDEAFETLRHLVNVFAVPPESLRSLILDDPALAADRIDRATIDDFIRLRADFKTARVARFL